MAGRNVRRYRANWQDEIDSAALYRVLAEAEQQEELAEVYSGLADSRPRMA